MEKQKTRKPSLNMQRNAYQITINNPEVNGFSHIIIKKALIENFSTLRYFCMADEIGEQGTYHTHVYVYFNSRVRFKTVKSISLRHILKLHTAIYKVTLITYVRKANGKILPKQKPV